ncbi:MULTISPECIES: transposase [unclassified Nocardia]|uniref:transposase n=1 Tax=unclassified Nocardia TaxID=2637762 RepID=UPI001CE3EDEC|nr:MULTISPECIES: transposase [unclassified Nocardia]
MAGKKGRRAGGGGRSKRRSFTAEYKLAIVAEYDGLTEPGARGALLRREGLYHSHVIEWRRARDEGGLNALAAKPTGPKPAKTEADRRVEKLEAELARTREELARKDKALAVLGKAHELLEMLSSSEDFDDKRQK